MERRQSYPTDTMLPILISTAVASASAGTASELTRGKSVPRLHGYSPTASILRCIGGLTAGASTTFLILYDLNLNYQPLQMPARGTPLPTLKRMNDVILYERVEDSQRKRAATVVSDSSLQHSLQSGDR